MSKVNLNKKSVKQQGGAMMQQMVQPQQQQVDPAVQEILTYFSTSLEQGGKPEEIVMSLMEQQIDQGTIAEALMTGGYQEEDITVLFENVRLMKQPKPATAAQVNANPQELARNEELAQNQQGPVATQPMEMAKSGIEIDPKNKGKFTRWAKARGMSVKEAYNKVMANTDAYPPSVVKMANFAKNAAGWKKEEGGEQEEFKPHFMYKGDRKIKANDVATHLRLKDAGYGHEPPKAQSGSEIDMPRTMAYGSNAYPSMGYMQGGGEEEVGLTEEQKNQQDQLMQFFDAANVTLTNQDNQYIGGKKPETSDEGILTTKNYFNPNAFKTGNNFSLGKVANVLNNAYQDMFAGDTDGDGLKDGSFRDWKNKTINNKINKELNANYNVKLDLSDENQAAIQAWKKQYDIENPEVDALGNPVVQENAGDDLDRNNTIEITNTPIQQAEEDFSNWFNSNMDGLSDAAKATYDAIREKMRSGNDDQEVIDEQITVQAYGSEIPKALFGFGKRAKKAKQKIKDDPMSFARLMAGDVTAATAFMQQGGDLYKAQFSAPETGAPFADPMDSDVVADDGPLSFQEWVQQDPVTRGTADAPQQYQAYVDGFNSDAAPDVTPDATEDAGVGPAQQRTAADLYGDIQGPEVTKDYGGLDGFTDRLINSNVARGFGSLSNFAFEAADSINDWYEDKNIRDAKNELRGNLVADNIYGTKTDAFNKRGTFDVNSGIMGSEGDRTTGLYLSKEGGGVNNPGFKALPPEAQHNILSNMAYGGAKGAEAYLANRDRVIKREMAKAQDGQETGKNHPYYEEYLEEFKSKGVGNKRALKILEEMNITPRDTAFVNQSNNKMGARMMNNADVVTFIADDLYNDGSGNYSGIVNMKNKMPYFSTPPASNGQSYDFLRNFYKGKGDNVVEVLKSKQPNNDASLMELFGLKQQGGEMTVNVDSTMLAKLIAAGADIELL